MSDLPIRRLPSADSAEARAPIATIVVLLLAIWGLLACWNVTLLGWQVGAPLGHWLEALLGAEGVEPGRALLGRFFFLLAGVLAVWLTVRRRALWQPHDPYVQEMVLDLKAATTTLLVFLACLGATLLFLVRNVFGGPGTWLDDTLGAPALGYPGVALLALATVILGLALRQVNRRLRHHPVYGREPRGR